MVKEVRIELTPAQKAKIKEATGKNVPEIRVSSLGSNIAVSPVQKDLRAQELSAQELRLRTSPRQELSAQESDGPGPCRPRSCRPRSLRLRSSPAQELSAQESVGPGSDGPGPHGAGAVGAGAVGPGAIGAGVSAQELSAQELSAQESDGPGALGSGAVRPGHSAIRGPRIPEALPVRSKRPALAGRFLYQTIERSQRQTTLQPREAKPSRAERIFTLAAAPGRRAPSGLSKTARTMKRSGFTEGAMGSFPSAVRGCSIVAGDIVATAPE